MLYSYFPYDTNRIKTDSYHFLPRGSFVSSPRVRCFRFSHAPTVSRETAETMGWVCNRCFDPSDPRPGLKQRKRRSRCLARACRHRGRTPTLCPNDPVSLNAHATFPFSDGPSNDREDSGNIGVDIAERRRFRTPSETTALAHRRNHRSDSLDSPTCVTNHRMS